MNLPPDKKAALMAKYGGPPADAPQPPMDEEEDMDMLPEERFVDTGEVVDESGLDEEDMDEEPSEPSVEPMPDEGSTVNDNTYNRRRGEEARAGRMRPIDDKVMREAVRKAVGNA